MTRYVQPLAEVKAGDRDWAGEKAVVLSELISAGFDVPAGFCISAAAYRDAFSANQLNDKISSRLAAIEMTDPAQLEQAAGEIRDWIAQAAASDELEAQIQSALAALHAPMTAVRASRVVEDVPNPSASGMQQAYLAVPASAVLEYVRRAWATPWNSRAIYFRQRKKIPPAQVAMAVIVQTMVSADSAGVMFTASPMGKDPNEIHIDAIWGLGEAVNAARWHPDHFVVEKSTLTVRAKNISTKSVMDVAASEGGVQTVGVPEDKQEVACLTDSQISALADTGKRVEAHFAAFQDIEWCLANERILLLQTRPLIRK